MSVIYIRDKDGKFIKVPSIPGKSAYEIAVEKGVFSGTEQEFAEGQVIKNKEIIDQITQENIDNWNASDVADLEKIESSENEPTDKKVSIWINTTKETPTNVIARINDDTVARNTTWSSEKIYQQMIDLTEKYEDLLAKYNELLQGTNSNIYYLQDINGDYLQDTNGDYLVFKEDI